MPMNCPRFSMLVSEALGSSAHKIVRAGDSSSVLNVLSMSQLSESLGGNRTPSISACTAVTSVSSIRLSSTKTTLSTLRETDAPTEHQGHSTPQEQSHVMR